MESYCGTLVVVKAENPPGGVSPSMVRRHINREFGARVIGVKATEMATSLGVPGGARGDWLAMNFPSACMGNGASGEPPITA